MDPENAVFLQFLDPDTAPFPQILDFQYDFCSAFSFFCELNVIDMLEDHTVVGKYAIKTFLATPPRPRCVQKTNTRGDQVLVPAGFEPPNASAPWVWAL